jgi:hypothetical protein
MYTGADAQVAQTIDEWTSSVVLARSPAAGAPVRK